MVPASRGADTSTLTRLLLLVVTVAGVSLLSAGAAMAQTTGARWQVSGDVGFQTTGIASILTEPITFERFGESGKVTRSLAINRQPRLQVAAGVSVWRNLGLRFGFSQFTQNDEIQLSVSIPHPFFFNRHRRFSQPTETADRERSVDVHALWMVHRGDRVAFSLFGGPTVFRWKLDAVGVQSREEKYPFEASPVTGIVTFRHTPVAVGYGAGADLAVFFSRYVGVGWLVRYDRATTTIALPDDGFFATVLGQPITTDVRLGGASISGGLRFRF